MDSPSEEKVTPKRSPRKRASADASKAPRRVEQKRASSPVRRKAPTAIASGQATKKMKRRQFVIIGASLVFGIGASALIGITDKGQIDVKKTIEARNERIRTNTTDERDVNTSLVEVPVQNTNTAGKADGGLVGRGTGGKKPQPAVVVASTTATSSDQTASSTDATASSSEAITDEGATAAEEETP